MPRPAAFSTPRRLALTVEGLTARKPDAPRRAQGPARRRAGQGDRGLPARRRRDPRRSSKSATTPKGEVYFAMIETPGPPGRRDRGRGAGEDASRDFPWPKSMRWGAGTPALGPPAAFDPLHPDRRGTAPRSCRWRSTGITAGDITRGHRFMAPDALRRDLVRGLRRPSSSAPSWSWTPPSGPRRSGTTRPSRPSRWASRWSRTPGLLTEVAGLVEWPVVLMGDIGDDFLDLPPEVLQTSMKEHQKFFSVRNPATGRIEHFVTVANRETADHGATILAGNRKVLAARLAGRQVLLGERPAHRHPPTGLERLARQARATSPSTTSSARRPTGSTGSPRWRARSRPWSAAEPDEADGPPGSAKADLASRDGLRVPRIAGADGPLLRRGRRALRRRRRRGLRGALRAARPLRRGAHRAGVGRRGARRQARHR